MVTGAARKRSIGHATAVRFARGAADVVVSSRYRPPDKFPEEEKAEGWKGLDSVVEEIESQGVRALAITADFTDSKQVKDMVDQTLAEFGRIDFLVTTAAINIPSPFLEIKEDDWHRVMKVNLDGVFYCCQAVARHMVERGESGAIVNVSSRAGKIGIERNGAYCASKFGVNGLTQVLAMELGPQNIRVNAVCPGRTLSSNQLSADDVWKLAREKGIDIMEATNILNKDSLPFIPLGRIALPEEIANVIVYLCSDEAGFITGQCINVDGGRLTAH